MPRNHESMALPYASSILSASSSAARSVLLVASMSSSVFARRSRGLADERTCTTFVRRLISRLHLSWTLLVRRRLDLQQLIKRFL